MTSPVVPPHSPTHSFYDNLSGLVLPSLTGIHEDPLRKVPIAFASDRVSVSGVQEAPRDIRAAGASEDEAMSRYVPFEPATRPMRRPHAARPYRRARSAFVPAYADAASALRTVARAAAERARILASVASLATSHAALCAGNARIARERDALLRENARLTRTSSVPAIRQTGRLDPPLCADDASEDIAVAGRHSANRPPVRIDALRESCAVDSSSCEAKLLGVRTALERATRRAGRLSAEIVRIGAANDALRGTSDSLRRQNEPSPARASVKGAPGCASVKRTA